MFIDVDSLILSSLRQERNVGSSEHRTPNGSAGSSAIRRL